MRLGLTRLDPHDGTDYLPQYALPDLVNSYTSWIYAITKTQNRAYELGRVGGSTSRERRHYLGDEATVRTVRGPVPRSALRPPSPTPNILPTDVGSRIGVVYVPAPRSPATAEMHFIINGEDQGPCTDDIPYRDGPLYAVVDVYGATKQVRIVQLYGVASLQSACRDAILQHIKKKSVSSLPLPKALKEYLLFQK
ncbi:hypothetical protein AAG570_013089 [Ranatra chinensis]|uniref:SOCS box domain-containing protein n=1 Tax=Ranatra chinensis TaxID=642074 RepID=A0ABD0YFS2_9HEMI